MRILFRKLSPLCSVRENTRMVGAGWSPLPKELSNSKRMVRKSTSQLTHGHQRQFCSVSSSSWRSEHLPKRLPSIFLPPGDGDSERRPLLEVAPLPSLPVPDQYHCCGSNFGWLVLVDDDLSMHLFNPVSGKKIQLPQATTLPSPYHPPEVGGHHKHCMRKAFLSCPPSDQTMVLVICGFVNRSLAFCRLGDQEWTPIKSIGRRIYVDAIYYDDKFYAMYNPGGVVTCDVHSSPPKVIEYAYPPKTEFVYMTRYLVQSEGYLFHIGRKDGFVETDDDEDDDENLSHCSEDYVGQMWWVNNFESDVETEEDDNQDGESHQHDGVETENTSNEDVKDGESHQHDGVETEDTANEDSKEEEKVTLESEEESSDKIDSESDSAEEGEESDSSEEENSEKDNRVSRTYGFKVFRLKMTDEGCACEKKWEKVDNIGDNAFFVGCFNNSFSLPALDVPGCKPNSIYFADSGWFGRGNDMGVFNLEDKSVVNFHPTHSKQTKEKPPVRPYTCPHATKEEKLPFWFNPTPP